MKLAKLFVTSDILRVALQLPENSVLRYIRESTNNYGVLEVVVEGEGWETPEGAAIRTTQIATIESGKIDWNLPNDNT